MQAVSQLCLGRVYHSRDTQPGETLTKPFSLCVPMVT